MQKVEVNPKLLYSEIMHGRQRAAYAALLRNGNYQALAALLNSSGKAGELFTGNVTADDIEEAATGKRTAARK